MAEDLTSLKRKRGAIKKRLTDFSKFIDIKKGIADENGSLERVIVIDIECRYEKIKALLDEFQVVQDKIDELQPDEVSDEMEQFENAFFTASSIAKYLIEVSENAIEARSVVQTRAGSIVTQVSQSANQANNIKLPTINLPKYNGNYTKWLEFRDTYNALIHNSENLSEIQKFYYLKSSVEGDAAKVIASMQTTANNYETAWALLCERYENKRLSVHNHIRALFDLPSVAKETAVQLRQILDAVTQHLRALSVLEQPVETWDAILIFIISTKFDSVTAREWESENIAGELPTLDEMKVFLKKKAEMLETLNFAKVNTSTCAIGNPKVQAKPQAKAFFSANTLKCYYCNGAHSVYNCKQFYELTVEARLQQVRAKKLCANCLRPDHLPNNCVARGCKYCHRKHNCLLHKPEKNETQTVTQEAERAPIGMMAQGCTTLRYSILSTVEVGAGINKQCRALLDTGAQSNLISKTAAEKINAKVIPLKNAVKGLGNCETEVIGKCLVTLNSKINDFKIRLECLVVPQIADDFSQPHLTKFQAEVDSKYELADPAFDKAGKIDILLGNGIFWGLMREGEFNMGAGKPILKNTVFGWILAGPMAWGLSRTGKPRCNFARETDIQAQLSKFWEVEECLFSDIRSDEEKGAEIHFTENFQRDQNGRFTVAIPFKRSVELLGDSEKGALQRFYNLERKLQAQPVLKRAYVDFMSEYIGLGHMSRVETGKEMNVAYYMPHHGVHKEDSTTTKLRVVFDASYVTTSGYSLNNLQMVGPVIQNDLLSILLNFRQHAIAISADITKMYRQVLIKEDERPLQRIFWRDDQSKPLEVYQLNTVTYGTAAASFLAVRCLEQLAKENEERFPEAATIIRKNFYVDDVLTGTDDPAHAEILCEQIDSILKQGCFTLRKWLSNDERVLSRVREASTEHHIVTISENEKAKTLGLYWAPKEDYLAFKVDNHISNEITKRVILSTISQIFDPLGLLGACIISAKIILQRIWKKGLDWDDQVPRDIQDKWAEFSTELPLLNTITIPRRITCDNSARVEIHGFSDASELAYGACVYLRSEDAHGCVATRLICSKAKVAPIKTLTTPRLELCAALILAKLVHKIKDSLTIEVDATLLWSDNQTVLAWLKTSPSVLKIFVANRIVQIQEHQGLATWHYVDTRSNPADLISRGVPPSQLLESTFWWNGPDWLVKDRSSWPSQPTHLKPEVSEMRPQFRVCVSVAKAESINIDKFSSLKRLTRVIATCRRFKYNAKCIGLEPRYGAITAVEIDEALRSLIKIAQHDSYQREINDLREEGRVQKKSSILALAPFIDKEGVLRVGGRLQFAELCYDEQHPAILSARHHLTFLIFKDIHIRLAHAGVQQMLCTIRERCWPVKARSVAKRVIRECVTCFRVKPSNNEPEMGMLPPKRVKRAFPFQHTGVDYAGPFLLRTRKGRGAKSTKCYIALFVCFAIKAVHLEIVSDLSSEAFIAALRRFIARRGRPSSIYSDNATNFVGTERELGRLLKTIESDQDKVIDALATEGVSWHFIPPNSPHFGGLWEAGVKRAKFHLKRVLINTTFTYEELCTVTCQIEAIMNSRPMTPLSDDPNDLEPLTPSHFLVGKRLTAIPEPSLLAVKSGRLLSFQRLQQIVQSFWARWSHEYLQQLNPRKKWRSSRAPDLKVGDLVLMREDNQPPMSWPLGRIEETFPGPDKVVRVASVKTSKGVYKRAVTKLYPLPNSEDKHDMITCDRDNPRVLPQVNCAT